MLLGLSGYQTASQNQLIAAYGNGFTNVLTGAGYGIPLSSSQNVEFANFLGSLFYQNYNDVPLSFNGTAWSRRHLAKLPLSKYLTPWQDRLYLGFIKIGTTEYPSRIWHSDLPVNDTIQWGYEQASNLTTTAGSNLVGSANAGFKAYDLEVGDPFLITSGSDAGEYRIKEIVSDQQVRLNDYNGNDTVLTATATGVSFWAGGNFFDVLRDNGDYLTWIDGKNRFNQLLAYKRDSLHRYNGSSLSEVRGVVGTTSGRSVQNIRQLNIYFYGGAVIKTGFYGYDSTDSNKISSPIQKYIDGISSDMYGSVVSWTEGNLYRAYVGDINNTNYNISIDNAVVTYDYESRSWSVDPIADVIKAAAEFRQITSVSSYVGNDDGEIFETPSGYTFNGTPVAFKVDTKAIYPSGTHFNNTFTRVQVISENAEGVRVLYRRRLSPFNSDDNFYPLGDIKGELTEFRIPEDRNRASGIEYRFLTSSVREPVAIIKKITTFYRRETTVIG